jgi:hypothetical protein
VFAGAAVSSRANGTAGLEESPSHTPGSEMDKLLTSLVCENSATSYFRAVEEYFRRGPFFSKKISTSLETVL